MKSISIFLSLSVSRRRFYTVKLCLIFWSEGIKYVCVIRSVSQLLENFTLHRQYHLWMSRRLISLWHLDCVNIAQSVSRPQRIKVLSISHRMERCSSRNRDVGYVSFLFMLCKLVCAFHVSMAHSCDGNMCVLMCVCVSAEWDRLWNKPPQQAFSSIWMLSRTRQNKV